MKTPHEQFQGGAVGAEHFRRASMLCNGVLPWMLAGVPPGAETPASGLSYAQLAREPQLFRVLIEGSHMHAVPGGDDLVEIWKRGREFIARAIRPKNGALRVLDVGSSNGLMLKTIQGEHNNVVPYGIDMSAEEVDAARALFPEYGNNFVASDVLRKTYETPGDRDLLGCFPSEFDVVYWGAWSPEEYRFTKEQPHMLRLLHDLASWTKEGGQLLIGFYDEALDAAYVENFGELGVHPEFAGRNPLGVESVYSLNPAEVLASLTYGM